MPSNKVKVAGVEIVAPALYSACKDFFEHVLHLSPPNEYEFFIKSIQKRYSGDLSKVSHDEHIEDVKTFVRYLKNPELQNDVLRVIKESFYLQCKVNGQIKWIHPFLQRILFPRSEDGLLLEEYYMNVADDISFVDYDMYYSSGVTFAELRLFAVSDDILTDANKTSGTYSTGKAGRQFTWYADDDFPWAMSIDKVEKVLSYISRNPHAKDSMIKSQIIFKLLQKNEDNLVGTIYTTDTDEPDKENEPSKIVHILRNDGYYYPLYNWDGKWIYTESNLLVSQKDISKHDLNKHLYGQLKNPK